MAGPDVFILDVIPATVHVEPVSRLGAQPSHETIIGEVVGSWAWGGGAALGPGSTLYHSNQCPGWYIHTFLTAHMATAGGGFSDYCLSQDKDVSPGNSGR